MPKVEDVRLPLRPRDHLRHTYCPIHCHGYNLNENILTLQNDTVEINSIRHLSVTVTHLTKFSFRHPPLGGVTWSKFRQPWLFNCRFWQH